MKILRIGCVLAGFLSLALSMPAQTFTTLYSFCAQASCTDGGYPAGELIQATNGDLYGTTRYGGANADGTVFKITPSGTLTTLHSFDFTDGYNPSAGLIQATNGDFYGTTYEGGASNSCFDGCGTVFKITPSGTLTTLHSFDLTDGEYPSAGLIQATKGDFYGTTYEGGANGYGTVFKITPSGTLTTLYSFCAQASCTDGSYPEAGLIQATNADLYGTTASGGANGYGTVFKITPGGTLTTLHSFDLTDGLSPLAGLIQATTGDFYGTTYEGGANSDGTVFKITLSGTLTTLYSFCAQASCTDGSYPEAGLVQATDGDLYGTTDGGGANSRGTVFKITPSGTLTTLYSFCSQSGCTDGTLPAGLIQDTNGSFYGTTYEGGANDAGTAFSLSVGLMPFVEIQTTFGKVGATVVILGNGLTGATAVSFNGTAATFTVASSTEIKTTVPTGATTGIVKVTTSSGSTLDSNVSFRVTPVILSFSPPSGPVGTIVTITGNSLTGATSVTFGSLNATSFTVNSYTQVTATVPTGAKTGKIGITTPGGTAKSTTSFTVN